MKRGGDKWAKVRRALKERFAAVGITRCEICFPQCWGNYCLSFAHAKKRRFLKDNELEHCVVACAPCHTAIEGLSHSEMQEIVENAIAARTVQP